MRKLEFMGIVHTNMRKFAKEMTIPGRDSLLIAPGTPQRYVVKEGIQVVPHDRCPTCWQVWDFKWSNPSCPHCDTTLGENCKILLDSDVCPFCEDGKVSMAKPRCNKCGHEIDPKTVVWG